MIKFDLIKGVLIGCMVLSLPLCTQYPITVVAFITSALLLFGVIVIETRDSDQMSSVQWEIESLKKQLAENSRDLKSLNFDLDKKDSQLTQFSVKSEALEARLESLEPDKLKADLKTLIESNNQIVMKMSMGQAFGGMNG